MASLGKIVFSDICINGFRSIDDDMEGTVKECAISQREGRSVKKAVLPENLIV